MAGSAPTPCPKGAKQFEPSGKGQLWIQWNTFGLEWSRTLGLVKTLELERPPFDSRGKYWIAKDTTPNRTKLLGWGFQLVGVPASIGLPGIPVRVSEPWEAPWKGVHVPDLGLPLRPYQTEALQMLQHNGGSGGLFLDPGLGKSLNSLAWLKWHPEIRPAVIVATANTKLQWRREARKWGLQDRVEILAGKTPRKLRKDGIYIVNWDILADWLDALLDTDPKTVIADESQNAGNSTSRRTKALKSLVAGRGFIPLSGTPFRTRPKQLWTTLHLLAPKLFPKEYGYLYRYCGPKPGWGGKLTFDGASNTEELHEKIRTVSIRRTKGDVLKDLPDRIYTPVLMDATVSPEYMEAQDRILKLQGVPISEIREKLEGLTTSAFFAKKEAVLDWVSEFLETGEKLVLMGWHVAVLDFLEAHFGRSCVRVSGGVSKERKEAAVHRFQTDAGCKVFLGQTVSAGVGIDGLQEVCSNMAFVELCWSWADVDQATSRLHRMGQQGAVNVYYLVLPGTVDELMLEALEERKTVMEKVIDGHADEESGSILDKLKAISRRQNAD